jgi:hypothetical protein
MGEMMKTKPWRKLWTSTRNDEKLRAMITRYGHECSWIWVCLLTSADDAGLIGLELEDLAYLCIVDENRLTELLSVFARKGLIIMEDDAISIANWEQYQHVESESAERVRQYRAREREKELKTEGQPERYSNVTVTDILEVELEEELENTQEARASEKTYPEEPEGPIIPDQPPPPMIRKQYPKLDWQKLHDLWTSIPGVPNPGGVYRLEAANGRDLLEAFNGLQPEAIYGAIENYRTMRSTPGIWWDANQPIHKWAQSSLDRFVPGNFTLADYIKKAPTSPPARGPLDDRPDAWTKADIDRLQAEKDQAEPTAPIDLSSEFRRRIAAAS